MNARNLATILVGLLITLSAQAQRVGNGTDGLALADAFAGIPAELNPIEKLTWAFEHGTTPDPVMITEATQGTKVYWAGLTFSYGLDLTVRPAGAAFLLGYIDDMGPLFPPQFSLISTSSEVDIINRTNFRDIDQRSYRQAKLINGTYIQETYNRHLDYRHTSEYRIYKGVIIQLSRITSDPAAGCNLFPSDKPDAKGICSATYYFSKKSSR